MKITTNNENKESKSIKAREITKSKKINPGISDYNASEKRQRLGERPTLS